MGIADRLRELTEKAKSSAAEHKGQIHQAVERAQTVADERTKGKYHDRIAKAGARFETYVERLPNGPQQGQRDQADAQPTAQAASQVRPVGGAERKTTATRS